MVADRNPPSSVGRLIGRWDGYPRRLAAASVAASVLVVLILLVSGLPSASATLAAAPPYTPMVGASTPARTVSALPAPAAGSHPLREVSSATPNRASLCLLGISSYCSSPDETPPALNATPSVDPPSSWKDITPSGANPAARVLPAEAYYPSGHEDILFGGEARVGATIVNEYFQDTWAYQDHVWSEVVNNATCTATTCPSARAGAMLAYYPPDNALILFGGYIVVGIFPYSSTVVYGDTWMFSGGAWTNVTASSGTGPSPRFQGAMTYDPSDNEIVLFGGSNASGISLGDTWTYASTGWKNVTSSEGGVTGYKADPPVAPEPRAGAAIANSPSGYVLLFGGEDSNATTTTIIENNCEGPTYYSRGISVVAWWFYRGSWARMGGWADTDTGLCTPPPPPSPVSPNSSAGPAAPLAITPVANPPCGRIDPALGWSPQNNRFALYGGYGPTSEASNGVCTGGPNYLNDTYIYAEAPGGTFYWSNAGDSGDPSGRYDMGYVSDLSAGYFEIFGGIGAAATDLGATWRFYELVHATLTGPSGWNSAGINLVNQGPFTATGFGGSGDLQIHFSATPLRDKSNNLGTSQGCGWFTNGTARAVPTDGTISLTCQPGPSSFNIYRLTAYVVDVNNTMDAASASWIFTVVPPEAMNVYSEYIGDFYSTVSFNDRITIYTDVAGIAASKITASIDGGTVKFVQSGSGSRWWNATVNMGNLPAGQRTLHAEAFFGGWTLNARDTFTVVSFPSWLTSVFQYAGANESVKGLGPGPFNRSFAINESYAWNLDNNLSFSFPMELLGGGYDMVPALKVVFSLTSQGDLSVTGSLPLTAPSITLGPASISVTVTFTLSGTFSVAGNGVHWVSAEAVVAISADLSASIPIYGFSILGVSVGFYLTVSIDPSVTLQLILAPATMPSQDLVSGIGIMIQRFLGTFTLALQAAVNFGIGIASIGLGAGVSVALQFGVNGGLGISGGWVNGSIFVTASFLWWSDSWNIVSGTIYHWDPPAAALQKGDATPDGVVYNNNGTGTKWVTQSRYYASGSYEGYDWNAVGTSGNAISDIYPYTEVSAAASYNGDYFFYTNDNTSLPITDGLGIAVAHLNASTNALGHLPAISDPNYYEIVSPQATTLADGDLYVLWAGLPQSEASIASPLNLTSLALQGAPFYPNNATWGPIRTFSSSRFAESYQVDATGAGGRVLELLSSTPLVGDATPESLVEFNLTTGAVVANWTTKGVSEVVSLRGASNLAEILDLDGNSSLIDLSTGAPVTLSFVPPSGDVLEAASLVQGSTHQAVLLYRGVNTSDLVLYDTSSSAAVASLALGGNTFEPEGIASATTDYLFVRTTEGIEGWTVQGTTFHNLTNLSEPAVESYGLVQAGGSIVVYAIATTGGNSTQPIDSLWLTELGATLAPVPPPSTPVKSSSTKSGPSPNSLLYLAILAVAVILLLAVVYVATRRKPPAPASPAPATPSPASPPTTAPHTPAPPSPPTPPPG
jgi:hypothetical protein